MVEGESTDNDVDGEDSSDDGDGEIVDDAEGDVGDDVFSVFSTSDNDPDGDDADGAVDDGRDIITTDCDDHLDENGDDGYDRRLKAWGFQHHRVDHGYMLHLVNRVDLARKKAYWDADKAYHDAYDNKERERYEQLEQDVLDRDARIANNVPSKDDRGFLENLRIKTASNTPGPCGSAPRAGRVALVRESVTRVNAQPVSDAYRATLKANYRVYVEASDTFIREQEELHARANRECSARAANGEDARDVRARWEAYERYGCCGALDDAFFDPRNG
jgi:hypothetical protein